MMSSEHISLKLQSTQRTYTFSCLCKCVGEIKCRQKNSPSRIWFAMQIIWCFFGKKILTREYSEYTWIRKHTAKLHERKKNVKIFVGSKRIALSHTQLKNNYNPRYPDHHHPIPPNPSPVNHAQNIPDQPNHSCLVIQYIIHKSVVKTRATGKLQINTSALPFTMCLGWHVLSRRFDVCCISCGCLSNGTVYKIGIIGFLYERC